MSRLVVRCQRLISDHLTPVLAYRRLVLPDDRTAPSFLFESVEQGGTVGRYSLLGARPAVEVMVKGNEAVIRKHRAGVSPENRSVPCTDGLALVRSICPPNIPYQSNGALPAAFWGGWVGFAGFDTVRWLEPSKLLFANAPADDRGLLDLHMGLYRCVVVFDHVDKTVSVVASEDIDDHGDTSGAEAAARATVDATVELLCREGASPASGVFDLDTRAVGTRPQARTWTPSQFMSAVDKAKEYISAGDVFQVVLSQRFERNTAADPFDLYRALRIVNPSPYQIYLQAEGAIFVAASPEILCRVKDGVVYSRPLAGTRPRGATAARDAELERELLADDKESAEHVMLVDLGRNDLGRICERGSITIERCMQVERYSHVMHISSTLSGKLAPGLDCYDALRATLPVGTVSGAPKIRAIEIIDELEPVRRGPYAGGIGAIGFPGDMDIALTLRTMVLPTAERSGNQWRVDIQAGAGLVLQSQPDREFEETVSKAAALGRAIDLAEQAFPKR